MSLAKRLLHGVSWLSLFSALGAFLSFGASILLARLLIPEEFGVYVLAATLAHLLALVLRFSFRSVIIQCRDPIPHLIDTTFLFILGMGVAHLLLAFIALPGIHWFYDSQTALGFMILSVMMVTKYLGNGLSALLERDLRYQAVGAINFTTSLASYIVAISAAFAGWGWWALILRDVSSTLFLGIITWIMTGHRFRLRYSNEAARYVWRFGRSLYVEQGISGLLEKLDNWVVGTFLGNAALGLYTIGYRLSGVANQFIEPVFGRGSFGAYSELQHDKPRLERAFSLVNFWLIRATIPVGIGALLFAEPAILWIYGENWAGAAPILQGLVILILLGPISSNARVLLTAIGKPNIVAANRVLQLIATVLLLIPATYFFGVAGVAWSMSLAALALFVLLLIQARHVIPIDFYGLFLRPLIAGSLTAILAGGISQTTTFSYLPHWGQFFAGGSTILLGYLITLGLLERRELLGRAQYILRRFRI